MVDYINYIHCQQLFCIQNKFCNVPLNDGGRYLDHTFGGCGTTTGGLGVLGRVIFHSASGLYGTPQSLPSKDPQICVGVA